MTWLLLFDFILVLNSFLTAHPPHSPQDDDLSGLRALMNDQRVYDTAPERIIKVIISWLMVLYY